MPGDPSPKAAPGGIIAYNGDSARGWNDPPTFAFNTNKAVNRPKLDLRKRVSHQQALGGSHTPPSAPNAFTSSQEVTDAVAGLKLNGAVQPIFTPPPVTTAPLTNNALTPPTIPPSFTRSVSSPSIANGNVSTIPVSQSPSNTVHSVNDLASLQTTSTEQPSANLIGQPLFHLRSHSYDPVKTAPLHSIRSTAEISEHFDDHHHGHTSPQIFHPVTPMITTTIQTQSVMPPIHTSPQIFHPITHPVTTTTNTMPGYQNGPSLTHPVVPLGHTTPPVVPLGHVTPPPPLPYQPPVGHVTPPLYAVTGLSSAPPVRPTQVMGVTPHLPAGHMTPPPAPSDHIVPPTSLSAGSTPRSSSPSEKDTDGTSLMDDKEGLRVTMDALQDVINKLQDRLQKRVADDISRRLQVMSQNWTNGKLSKGVKSRMIKLAKALDDGNVNEAHHIHVSLMVDFVAEVNQWMVAVKKLISLVRSSNAEVLQS